MERCESMLSTKRLRIRRIRKSDLHDLQEYASQEEVAQEAEFTVCKTMNDVHAFYDILDNDHTWVLEYVAENKVIGNICLYEQIGEYNEPQPAKRIAGYALNANYWGQDFMTESLGGICIWAQQNDIKEIIGIVSDTNHASQRVLEKNGFELVAKNKPNPFLRNASMKQVYTYRRIFN